jgi:hypothetical protein
MVGNVEKAMDGERCNNAIAPCALKRHLRLPATPKETVSQLAPHPTQVEQAVDLAYQMIQGHHLVEIKGMEVRPLAAPSWTAPVDDRLKRTESWFAGRLNGTFATQSREDRSCCAFAGMAECDPGCVKTPQAEKRGEWTFSDRSKIDRADKF